MIGKCCKLFDDDLLLNMMNKTVVLLYLLKITIKTLMYSKHKRSELTTLENTIAYHNTPCLSPQNFT